MPTTLNTDLRGRLERQLLLVERLHVTNPDVAATIVGHMMIERDGRIDDIFLGRQSAVLGGMPVLDWRRAPLAKAFFGSIEGEEFEIQFQGRKTTGRLLQRNLLSLSDGVLIELRTPTHVLRRSDQAGPARHTGPDPRQTEWEAVPTSSNFLSSALQGGAGRRLPSERELDAQQRAALRLPDSQPVLIAGEAGSGKTTVALMRLAELCRNRPPSYRALVVLPSEPLQRVASAILRALGVLARVEVCTFDDWAAEQARRCFPDLPRRIARDTSAAVVRLKRHAALQPVLAELAARPPALPDPEGPRRHFLSDGLARHADLEHLFGDRILMERVAAASGGAIGDSAVAEVLEHTHVQFSATAEEEFDFVDPDRLITLDRALLDEGTPMEDAATVDFEDYPVMFELERLRAEARGSRPAAPSAFDCVVVDEAQELSPLELRLVGRALSRHGTLIVSGDDAQQVDPTTSFEGWKAAMRDLGAPKYRQITLSSGYRSNPGIRAFTRDIVWRSAERRRSRATPAPPQSPAASAVRRERFPGECHLLTWLIDELRAHERAAPGTSVAVIFRDSEHAAGMGAILRQATALRFAGGDDEVRSGACITTVPLVKGLELDAAIVVDVSAERYPDTPQYRRALYVACTRARHRLILTSAGPWSTILERHAR